MQVRRLIYHNKYNFSSHLNKITLLRRYIRIDGATPPTVRSGLVESFQKNEDVRVAILSIRAAGVGLTLTAASTVVFAEMTWTPGEIIQAEGVSETLLPIKVPNNMTALVYVIDKHLCCPADRAHRIGQLNSVNVYFLHVKNSIDDIIWSSIQNKLEKLGQTLDGIDQTLELCQSRVMPEKGGCHPVKSMLCLNDSYNNRNIEESVFSSFSGQQSLDRFLTPSQPLSQNIDVTSKSPETRNPKRKNFDI